MKYLFTFFFSLFFQVCFSQASLQGTVTDAETGEPIIFGTVAVYKLGKLIYGPSTNLEGFYSIENLNEGIYEIQFSYTNHNITKKPNRLLFKNKTSVLNAQLNIDEDAGDAVIIIRDIPIIHVDDLTQGFIFSAGQIRNMPHRGN